MIIPSVLCHSITIFTTSHDQNSLITTTVIKTHQYAIFQHKNVINLVNVSPSVEHPKIPKNNGRLYIRSTMPQTSHKVKIYNVLTLSSIHYRDAAPAPAFSNTYPPSNNRTASNKHSRRQQPKRQICFSLNLTHNSNFTMRRVMPRTLLLWP